MLHVERALLQEGERHRVMGRCAEVDAAGALPLLVQLCAGPEGPLPAHVATPAPEAGAVDKVQAENEKGKARKKKKKGGKKGKKAKLEPGVLCRLDRLKIRRM
jgi:hypothetical protein